ncbi:uncharacterized protein NEMAJ01_1805 [Nematocida major]|uniref:uncharacterized protein n=1 Tax=Nematocida major TaxID=1912982 RepID=UPI002007CAD9|nr:uncharacterized protein NEMAJ01_1805 [Nematocida major]KAH9386909.1 hypothetical protein NEMAJ01_1805 [Nematocida major]
MAFIYSAVYSNRNILIEESKTEGNDRILVYSAVEIMDCIIRESKTDTFLGIVQYNGKKASGLLLENGYKVLGVFEACHDERPEMKELGVRVRGRIANGDFNRFEF